MFPVKSGVYRVSLKGLDYFYIGGTVNLNSRMNDHKKRLRYGNHHNKKLLELYSISQDVVFEVIEFCSLEEVKSVEQKYLDKFKGSPFLLNIAIDSIHATKGLKWSAAQTEWHKNWFKANKDKIPYAKGAKNHNSKKVINILTSKIFDCAREAHEESGLKTTLDAFNATLNPNKPTKNKTNYMYLSDYLTNKECTMEDFLKNRKAA